MNRKTLEKEVIELKRIKHSWKGTSHDRQKVRDLLSKIRNFNHSFTVKFPLASKYYDRNGFAEIAITDGIEDLEHYIGTTTKYKDQRFHRSGMKHLINGLEILIDKLEDNYIDKSKKDFHTNDACPEAGAWICFMHPSDDVILNKGDLFPKCKHISGHNTTWLKLKQ